MTLIWKSLLHANFRCGRMYSARAEKQTLSHSCTVPSMPRMCERMCPPRQTKGSELRTISLPGRRKVKLPTLPGIFMSKNNTLSTDREEKYYV